MINRSFVSFIIIIIYLFFFFFFFIFFGGVGGVGGGAGGTNSDKHSLFPEYIHMFSSCFSLLTLVFSTRVLVE